MVEFCPDCGGMLCPKKYKEVFMLECASCGFYEMLEKMPELKTKEKRVNPKSIGEGYVNEGNIFATHEHKCSKCNFNKAELIDAGVFYSDEDNIYILKCGKCGFSERIGDMS